MIWAQKSLKVSDNGSGERTNCGGPFETRQTFWLAPSLIMTACETPAKISLSLLPFHLQMETSILWIFIRFRVTESFMSCPSVCLTAWNNSAPTGRILIKFNIWVFFHKTVQEIQIR